MSCRELLPQLNGTPCLTDGGMETSLTFHRGLRANASTKSHAELDEAEELDEGDPGELAACYVEPARRLPKLSVVGGCCGTDHRHIDAISMILST